MGEKGRGDSGEDLQLAYSFPWPAQRVCSQGMFAGVGGWVTEMSLGKEGFEEDHCDLSRMGSEKKGRPQYVFSYRAEDENGGG